MSPSEHEKRPGQEHLAWPSSDSPHGNNGFGSLSVVEGFFLVFRYIISSQVVFSHSHKVYYAFTLCSGCDCDYCVCFCKSETSQGRVSHYSLIFNPLQFMFRKGSLYLCLFTLYNSSSSVNFGL